MEDETYVNLIAETFMNKIVELNDIEDKRVKWDILKFEFQNVSIEYSIQKARERRKLENDILLKCDKLYEKLCDKGLDLDEERQYSDTNLY